jgi:hypothetical protein
MGAAESSIDFDSIRRIRRQFGKKDRLVGRIAEPSDSARAVAASTIRNLLSG